MQTGLFQLRQNHREQTPAWPSFRHRTVGTARPRTGDTRDEAGWKGAMRRFVIVKRQADLLEIVTALHPSSRFARRLHSGQQQADQDANDGHDHQQSTSVNPERTIPAILVTRPIAVWRSTNPHNPWFLSAIKQDPSN